MMSPVLPPPRSARPVLRRLLGLMAALGALLGASCSSYSDYVFAPSVHDIEVRDPAEELLARVLIAPRGIAGRKTADGHRVDVRFRVRLENRSGAPLVLVPEELELVDANLESFGPPEVVPVTSKMEGEETTESGTESVYMLYFPFPGERTPSTMDLRSLRLRLGLRHGEELLLPTAIFERAYRYYYDPYYYPYPGYRWSVGIGYGVCY